ncbi:Protein pitchfork [Vulpes lagopus]
MCWGNTLQGVQPSWPHDQEHPLRNFSQAKCFLEFAKYLVVAESLVNYPFGTSQPRKLFPHHHPPSLLGNKFLPLRGAPHRGPGCYIAEDVYGLAYNLSKIPTSKKGYTFGARTAERFKTINKVRNG